MAYAEITGNRLCVLSLDFSAAFDRISHNYLFRILKAHGLHNDTITLTESIYNTATSRIQINGHVSQPTEIRCSVRQGCPLSMILYALCLNPLLYRLAENVSGIRVNPQQETTHADNVTTELFKPEDIEKVAEILTDNMDATGVKININKSAAIPLGDWPCNRSIMAIIFVQETKIIAVRFATTIRETKQTIMRYGAGKKKTIGTRKLPAPIVLKTTNTLCTHVHPC